MLNKFIGIGRLTKDAELKYVQNGGKAVATFTIAMDNGFGEKKTTDFINCVVWDKTAENLASFTQKGSLIAVDGRVTTRSYDDKDGNKRYVTEIVARDVRFLDSKKEVAATNAGAPKEYSNVFADPDFSADDMPF